MISYLLRDASAHSVAYNVISCYEITSELLLMYSGSILRKFLATSLNLPQLKSYSPYAH